MLLGILYRQILDVANGPLTDAIEDGCFVWQAFLAQRLHGLNVHVVSNTASKETLSGPLTVH